MVSEYELKTVRTIAGLILVLSFACGMQSLHTKTRGISTAIKKVPQPRQRLHRLAQTEISATRNRYLRSIRTHRRTAASSHGMAVRQFDGRWILWINIFMSQYLEAYL
ncbi:hypothetical protein Q5692_30960 [Microcoleus sp. C2C3]|uniref:hypothetical protein n=1 Tax=unclassified Microcoleus TaxID=2642155 RepID=UPI002FD67714